MVRKFSLAVGMLVLAGCVTPEAEYGSRAPVIYGPQTAPPPAGPSIYDSAPRAAVFSELIACNNGSGSNVGEIGYRGEAVLYAPYIQTLAGPLLRNPTEGSCLSSGFGWRGSLNGGRAHNGLDLANANGGFIYAAGEGRIAFADYRGGFGNVVEIDHGQGVRTLYAHMSEFDQRLRPGVPVWQGTAIGRMGMTGNATGIHLHYEVYIDGLLVDPLHYGRPPTMISAPMREPPPLPTVTPLSAPPPDHAQLPSLNTLPPPEEIIVSDKPAY